MPDSPDPIHPPSLEPLEPFEQTADPDAAFVALLTGHQLAIRLYVQSLLPGHEAAKDVAQLANATIWKKREDFQLGTNFKAWVFTICRYEVLNFRKKQARDRLVFSPELEDIMAAELPARADELEARQRALRVCLGKLKPADRTLVEHRYFSGISLADYAASNQRSVGGLRVALHRIRNALQACIRDQQLLGGAA